MTAFALTARGDAVRRAMALLHAAKAEFKIVTAEGVTHGDLEDMPTAKRRRNFAASGYADKIKALTIGETAIIDVPVDVPIYEFADIARRVAAYHFSKSGFSLGVQEEIRKLEILRVA